MGLIIVVETVITGVGKDPEKAGDGSVGQILLTPTTYHDEVTSLCYAFSCFSANIKLKY